VRELLRIRIERFLAEPSAFALKDYLFAPLAVDALNSNLLGRLLEGEEPLPFEEWRR